MSNSLKAWPDLLHSKNSYSLSNWNSNPRAPRWHLLKPKQNCNSVLVQVPLAGYRSVTASQKCRSSCGHRCSLTCTWCMSKTWGLQTSSSVWHILQKVSLSGRSVPVLEQANWSPRGNLSWEPLSHSLWKIKLLDFTFPCRSPNTDLRAQGSEVQILTRCEHLELAARPNTDWNISCSPFPSWPCLPTAVLYIYLHMLI